MIVTGVFRVARPGCRNDLDTAVTTCARRFGFRVLVMIVVVVMGVR